MSRNYNLKRQEPDDRDYKLKIEKLKKIPTRVDLREKCPKIWDQGNLGACTAFAGCAALMTLKNLNVDMSKLYLYYKERELEGNVCLDSGASMRSIVKALQKFGTCEESVYPYLVRRYANKPPKAADDNAAKYRINSYLTFGNDGMDDVPQIKQYIAQNELDVLIGMDVFESFERVEPNGIVPLPNTYVEAHLGGHAILIVGYDDFFRKKPNFFVRVANKLLGSTDDGETGYFICRNSWGDGWGDDGYFYLPYSFVRKGHAFDAWVIS